MTENFADDVVDMDEQSKIDEENATEGTIIEDTGTVPDDEDSEIDEEADPEPESDIKEGSD